VYKIRPAVPADLHEMYVLELESFSTPWTRESLAAFITDSPVRKCFVAVDDSPKTMVLGYIGIQYVGEEAEIVNIAVHPDNRNTGIGSALLDCAEHFCETSGVFILHLEVREGNLPAIHLYQKHGFRKVGLRKGYYADSREDAHLYSLNIGKRYGVVTVFEDLSIGPDKT
jgi:ribosomal-protein-alanine N-acetyltransferase